MPLVSSCFIYGGRSGKGGEGIAGMRRGKGGRRLIEKEREGYFPEEAQGRNT